MTNCDKIDAEVKKDVTTLFWSEIVKERVEAARDYVCLPKMNILPTVNYADDDFDATINKNVLSLFNLWYILMRAEAYAVKCTETTYDSELEDD
ncbi:hypothetical protein MHBO_004254 [Bonamia ostreae]|uniref:Uncharacterized protein n=1 Tax=Bonamia ostreae TaxID=126728 RepID=A0ABV2ASS5_9EUKA